MAQRIGDRLPADLVSLFDGTGSDLHVAYPLVTVDEAGTPRFSMLSAGELLATGDRAIRIAMWPNTRTGVNLASGREALLCVVVPGSVRYVRGHAARLVAPPEVALECFELTVSSVESDGHDGMPVATPITFDVVDPSPAEVLAAWRTQLAALAAATPGTG
ncbi:MAG TPA: hypothetical protein VFW65_21035 [Pseudonocardiaceae bacterium]|nr:hypothetical protein [Pseudonocardiaceae bacterium]